MKSIILFFKDILIKIFSSIILPLVDTFQVVINLVSKILNVEYEQLNKMTKELDVIIKKNMYYSLIVYYLFLLIVEIYILINILGGKITYYSFWDLSIYSFSFISYNLFSIIILITIGCCILDSKHRRSYYLFKRFKLRSMDIFI